MRPLALRLLALAAGVALALGSAPPPAAASPSEWFPLEEGEEHRFRLERTRSVRVDGNTTGREFLVGESVLSAVGTASGPRVRVRQVEIEREPRLLDERRPSRRRESFLYSLRDDAMRLHEHSQESGTQTYDPPLLFLRAPLREGQRWDVGTLQSRGLDVALEAQVTGRGALSVEGRRYEDALHVQYTGSVSGVRRGESGEHEIRDGRYERNLWLVRGLGPVRDVVEVELDLRTSDGERIEMSSETRRTRWPEEGASSGGPAASAP